jgi:hypothetical protein
LEADCNQFKLKSSDAKVSLETTLNSLQDYDDTYDDLNQWTRDLEAQIRDHELMSTLPEKMDQVEKFKVCYVFVASEPKTYREIAHVRICHFAGEEPTCKRKLCLREMDFT